MSWTWNQPNGNGRPVSGYQYSLDGGAWQTRPAAFLLQERGLRAKPTRSGSGPSAPASPAASAATSRAARTRRRRSRVQIQAHNNTCPGKPGEPDTYNPSGPSCGAGWVCTSEGRLNINCTKDIYGNGTPWFRVTEGSHPGWFVKSTTVDLYGPRPGGC